MSPSAAVDLQAKGDGLTGQAQHAIVIPDAHLLFSGDYRRAGVDLVLSKDGHDHVVHEYFKTHFRATLASPDGAQLSGAMVDALTGEVQVAQLAGATAAAVVIGRVTKLTGSATAIRNGVSIQLNMGDTVNKGDVVQAGSDSSLGLTFIDGTVFGLSSNARMVLNEMVYDPNGSSNSSLLSLVQGTISFVAGETAKNGNMKVDTPVATMGIRGTAVLVEIDFTVPGTGGAPPVKFQVLVEPGGKIGSYVLYSKSDPNLVIGTVNQAGQVTSVGGDGNTSTTTAPLSPEALAIIPQIFQLYFPNYVPNANPKSTNPNNGSTPSTPTPGSSDPDPIKFVPTPDLPVGVPTTVPVSLPGDTPTTPPIIVTITRLNTAPTIEVAPVVVTLPVDNAGFNLADQVKITDPDIGDGRFNDVAIPYVPGTGKVISAVGPAKMPAGLDLGGLVTVNPLTGAVSYDPAAFRFLGEGQKAVFTIAFDSQSGPDTIHETLTFTVDGVNDAPVIGDARLVVAEGGTVVLTAASFAVSDADSDTFRFTVTNVTHGKFQISADGITWIDAAVFTTADLNAGHVRFVHDGSKAGSRFSVTADDGASASHLSNVVTGTVDITSINNAPLITVASLFIAEGATVVLTAANIGISDPDSSSFSFAVSNVSHGRFQITNGVNWTDATSFTTADLNAGHVRFVHDGSETAPAFSITADDGGAINHVSALVAGSVTFTHVNDAPVITAAGLTVAEGGTVVLTAANIGISDPDSSSFSFAVSNVSHGRFQITNGVNWTDATSFTTADLNAGHVRFVHDGGEAAPTFSIQSDDGGGANHLSNTFAGSVAFTHVNDAPVITAASLSVSNGGTIVVQLTDIGISDPDGSGFIFYAETTHGSFEFFDGESWVTIKPEDSITSADIAAGHVRFHHDGSGIAPDITVVVSDGSAVSASFEADVAFTGANYRLTSSEGVSIDISPHGATNGFTFPGAGNVTTPGIPEDRIILGYDIGANHVVLNGAPMMNDTDFTPVSSVQTHNADGSDSVATKLGADNGVTLTQTINLGSDANYFTTTIDIFNGGTTDLDHVRFMRNFDPDQDVNTHGTVYTSNDVIHQPTGTNDVAIVSAKGNASGAEVALIGLAGDWRASSYDFTNTDPYAARAYDSPVDPDGAVADNAISLTYDFDTIAAGTHATVTYLTSANVATDGSNALFRSAGSENPNIEGLKGDDLLIGLDGTDNFVFRAGDGRDTVLNFTHGDDTIDLSALSTIPLDDNGSFTEAALDAWKSQEAFESIGNDTLIHLEGSTDTLLLKNVSVASLHASDFIVHPYQV